MTTKNAVNFDVIVVGAGHAGVEASLASARLGKKTLVVTTNLERIGYMSCNPSIGGLAKGHMVREIDFLGGEMGRVADETCIQFKRLNARKGPAVRGSRSQCDKDLYCERMKAVLQSEENISLLEDEVKSLILEKDQCLGVVLGDGSQIFSKCTILTTGTFMNAVMHIGHQRIEGGRVGDKASVGLSDQIADYGFAVKRLKTGTPPRLAADSIDWSKTEEQWGDETFYPFSFRSENELKLPQISCFLSHTNEETHEIIRKNLQHSPMFRGDIEGTGPRYCPSIEDKITRFAEKASHQTFLEPEGLNTNYIYLQGISTSLPEEIQYEFLRTIPGLENVKMLRPGYAVEYDFIEPTQIWHSLETRQINHLFFAGQINGTSGYEEAAAQGLIAGVNAARKIDERESLILSRDRAYIGVLIDDLVTKGTNEPYRMFTSRAEHRLLLREDNTGERLANVGYESGLLDSETYSQFEAVSEQRNQLFSRLKEHKIYPNQETNDLLLQIGTTVLQKPITLEELLRRNEVHCSHLSMFGIETVFGPEVSEPVEIAVKYSGYIKRQQEMVEQTKKLDRMKIPADLEFSKVRGLSNEEIEKLSKVRPVSIGQAQRISGVNPSAVQALIIYLKGRKKVVELNVV